MSCPCWPNCAWQKRTLHNQQQACHCFFSKERTQPQHTASSEGKWYKQGGGVDTEANKEDDKGKDEPHKIGYRTFPNGSAAHKYYRMLLKELTPNQDLNEVGHQCKSPKLSVLCLLA